MTRKYLRINNLETVQELVGVYGPPI